MDERIGEINQKIYMYYPYIYRQRCGDGQRKNGVTVGGGGVDICNSVNKKKVKLNVGYNYFNFETN